MEFEKNTQLRSRCYMYWQQYFSSSYFFAFILLNTQSVYKDVYNTHFFKLNVMLNTTYIQKRRSSYIKNHHTKLDHFCVEIIKSHSRHLRFKYKFPVFIRLFIMYLFENYECSVINHICTIIDNPILSKIAQPMQVNRL